MPLKAGQLEANLHQGLAPLYLLAGDEELLVTEAADRVREAAREAGYLERTLFSVDNRFKWETLAGARESRSLFAERKLIEVRIPGGKPGVAGSKALVAWAENPDPDNLLLVVCNSWDAGSRKAKWVKALDKAGVYVQFWPVGREELPRWLQQRMLALGLRPEAGVTELMAEQLEGNLLAAAQEVQKLWLLKGADTVSMEDIRSGVVDSARFDVFRMIDAAMLARVGRACRMASSLQAAAVNENMLLGGLVFSIQSLFKARTLVDGGEPESSALRQAGVWGERQKTVAAALRRLDGRVLAAIMRQLQLLDRIAKGQQHGSGMEQFWIELDNLLLLFAGNDPARGRVA